MNDFNRAVARATGESVETITQRGFILLTPVPFERERRTADYDEFLKRVPASVRRQGKNRATA